MNDIFVSELTKKLLTEADEFAGKNMEDLCSQPTMEGVIKGQERSGWIGIIHVGLWPGPEGMEKKYIIHTSLEGTARSGRNVEWGKIHGFFMAKHIMRNLYDSTRTVYTPAVRGQKIASQDNDERIVREIYVNYEPRHLVHTTPGVDSDEYAYLLGRDVVRFLFVGMTNAPRHIRPNFSRDSIRKTCMIDLDQFDPRTFHWNPVDLYPRDSINNQILSGHEKTFFHAIALYFFDTLLPKDFDNRQEMVKKFKDTYYEGAVEEINKLKGKKVGGSIVSRLLE